MITYDVDKMCKMASPSLGQGLINQGSVPPQATGIQAALNSMHEQIEYLLKCIDGMALRLRPVMMISTEQTGPGKNSTVRHVGCEITNCISNLEDMIREAKNAIEGIHNALDL